MTTWDEFTEPCPNCEGDGCEVCDGGGKLVVPSRVQEYVTELQQQLLRLRETRRVMLDTYERWATASEEQTTQIMLLVATTIYRDDLKDTPEGRREFDQLMSKDILEMEDRLAQIKILIGSGQEMVAGARESWRQAKRARKLRTAKPAPPPLPPPKPKKHTKAAGVVCSKPNCQKDAREWDEKGRGWCRKHAYERGLMDRPKVEEDE